MRKRLGIIRHRYAQPLFNGLRHQPPDSPVRFDLVQESAPQLLLKLLQDELDGAFLSPFEYAKNFSELKIVKDVCVASYDESGIIELHFGDNLRDLKTLAINPESGSETVLAKLLLTEKFDISPQLIAVQQIVPEVLKKSDSALVVGDDVAMWEDHANKIDLVDQWNDLTELPYVHGFWVTKEDNLTTDELSILTTIIAADHDIEYLDSTYMLDDAVLNSLTELYRLAFYYGILKEIPEIKMLD